MKALLVLMITSLFAVGRVSADIVVNHPPLNTGGPAADTEFINDSDQQSWQQLADDFQVSDNVIIRRVTWWGFYGSSFLEEVEPPPATETMRIRFYGSRDVDGLPDETNIFFDESFSNPLRTPTGRYVSVGPLSPEFRFEANLSSPLILEAAMPYWLEIVQIGDIDSAFRWQYSPGTGSPFSFVNPFLTDWRRTTLTADLSFELSTVPEPSSSFLFICCYVLWGRKKR